MATAPLLDREFLEKLERLTIRWTKSFPGLVGGHNPSRFAGGGQEFFDHRHFHHGDDLRAVNWRAYLRLEKLFLKMFQVEPRIPVRLLLDCSLSMATPAPDKFRFARRLAAALCYVGLVRLDTITVQPFSSGLGERFISSGGRHRFLPVVNWLSALEPDGRTGFLRSVREFLTTYSQRGLLIVISDFLDEDGCEKPLQFLADFGHELMLLHVWAEEDRAPPWQGELDLVDAETHQQLRIQVDPEARQRYTKSFDDYAAGIEHLAARAGGRYVGVSTTVPLEDVIFGAMMQAKGLE
ncbi:MAG: DUF58 domain-containing protein [Bryobacteraceae bacterium]